MSLRDILRRLQLSEFVAEGEAGEEEVGGVRAGLKAGMDKLARGLFLVCLNACPPACQEVAAFGVFLQFTVTMRQHE